MFVGTDGKLVDVVAGSAELLLVTLSRIALASKGQIPTDISFDFDHIIYGEIYLPDLAKEETIRAGEKAALSMNSFLINRGKSPFLIDL